MEPGKKKKFILFLVLFVLLQSVFFIISSFVLSSTVAPGGDPWYALSHLVVNARVPGSAAESTIKSTVRQQEEPITKEFIAHDAGLKENNLTQIAFCCENNPECTKSFDPEFFDCSEEEIIPKKSVQLKFFVRHIPRDDNLTIYYLGAVDEKPLPLLEEWEKNLLIYNLVFAFIQGIILYFLLFRVWKNGKKVGKKEN